MKLVIGTLLMEKRNLSTGLLHQPLASTVEKYSLVKKFQELKAILA